ncbi:MAG TPA: Uma2 family endonuclease [Tepidisphaeraceae bacterium]|nr:Uma2 family endonuclease [Tepidisphaeraceae bacterium]
MPLGPAASSPFIPGTTGWTADDLDDPQIERQWENGAYEIIEGVLTTMAPAYYVGGKALFRLMCEITARVGQAAGSFCPGAEVVIDQTWVIRADAVFLTPDQEARQTQAALAAGAIDPNRKRILIPPLLIIESISPGHEMHDRRTKRRWYAEFGVANYWLFDAFARSLQCLVLENGVYREDAAGSGEQDVRPSLFPGLVVPLKGLWAS